MTSKYQKIDVWRHWLMVYMFMMYKPCICVTISVYIFNRALVIIYRCLTLISEDSERSNISKYQIIIDATECKLWWLVLTLVLFLCVAGSLPDGRSEDTIIPDLIITMAKHHILIDPAKPSTFKQSRPPPITNWELCILCQAETGETLQCPLRSTMKPSGVGYASLT